jgi:von Willebrand factor type A domain
MFTKKITSKWAAIAALLCVLIIISCSQQKNQSKILDLQKTADNTATDAPKPVSVEISEVTVAGAAAGKTTEEHKNEETRTEEVIEYLDSTPVEMERAKDETSATKAIAKKSTSTTISTTLAMPLVGETKSVVLYIADDSGMGDKAPVHAAPREDMVHDVYSEDEPVFGGTATAVNASLAGKLTAGEINDFKKWKMWEDLTEGELKKCALIWQLNPKERYTALVLTESGAPVVDCVVELIAKGNEVIWKARTDNTGKAELWGVLGSNDEAKKIDRIEVKRDNKIFTIDHPKEFEKGLNIIKLPVSCNIPDNVDICFTVDATGSMGDEIAYLQAELLDVIAKVKTKHSDANVSLGSVFYRDHGDTYLTRNFSFVSDATKVNQFIAEQYADGGGDGPEAVDEALRVSIEQMNWNNEARARLMFIILDAPPHGAEANLTALQAAMRNAAAKGIRIIPLVASGGGYDMDKSLEYLMRCCALSTNGTYAFLTNHSGIGGHHTAPSADKYEVETLNELLQRVISEYLMVPNCNLQQFVTNQQLENDTVSVLNELEPMADSLLAQNDTSAVNVEPITNDIVILKCYPNPATDYIWVETSSDVKELFLADNSGKLMQRMVPAASLFQMDLTFYPSGIYYLKAWINDKWVSARIIVARLH